MTQQTSFSAEAYECFGKQTEFVFKFCLKISGRPSVAVALVDKAARTLVGDRSFQKSKDHKKGLIGVATVRTLLGKDPSLLKKAVSAETMKDPDRIILVDILKLQYLDDAARLCVLLHHEGLSAKEIHDELSARVAANLMTEPNARVYLAIGSKGILNLLKTEWADIIVDSEVGRLKPREAYDEST